MEKEKEKERASEPDSAMSVQSPAKKKDDKTPVKLIDMSVHHCFLTNEVSFEEVTVTTVILV